MHLSDSAPTAPCSQYPERVTTLPRLGRDVEDWMWKVLNGGTVVSDRRIGDAQKVHAHALTLRTIGGNGQADQELPAETLAKAAEYARLLGWTVADEA